MNTLYIGVDFHPHQQTVAWCDEQTGEIKTRELFHDQGDQVARFYQRMRSGVVGLEASSQAVWFEKLLERTGHQLKVGNPVLIRRRAVSRHKSDRRDAELILELLIKGEFPAIWRRSQENDEILQILKLRIGLVRHRTQIYNRLQALAKSHGLPRGKMSAKYYQQWVGELHLSEAGQLQRKQLFGLASELSERIEQLESWLKRRAEKDARVQLLQTQPGVGYQTALALVNSIGRISRFDRPTKQIPAYLGLEPLERESAGRRKAAGISRAGNGLTRYLLGQSANICVRYDRRFKSFYNRLAKKKPKPVAKMATARKVLVKLVIMWRDAITSEEFDRRGGGAVSDARRTEGLQEP